jgi:hypothetical protein
MLEGLGLLVQSECAFDPDVFEFLAGNPLLKYERNVVRWFAAGEIGGRPVRLAEYRYATGHGRGVTEHTNLVASTDLLLDVPAFTMQRKRWLYLHAASESPTTVECGEDDIAEEFEFYSSKGADARPIVVPAASILRKWDKSRWLRFRQGDISTGRRNKPAPADIRSMIDELFALVDAVETPDRKTNRPASPRA